MDKFSYVCQNCGKGVSLGEPVHLFLLWGGNIIDKLSGPYDSLGAILDVNGKSVPWKTGQSNVDTLNNVSNRQSGVAAFHISCYRGILPDYQSKCIIEKV
jgi:hypothetical protein